MFGMKESETTFGTAWPWGSNFSVTMANSSGSGFSQREVSLTMLPFSIAVVNSRESCQHALGLHASSSSVDMTLCPTQLQPLPHEIQ